MTSKHLVDKDLITMLDAMPSIALSREALPAIRAGLLDAMTAAQPPADSKVSLTEHRIAGPEGAPELRLLEYRPQDVDHAPKLLPVLLHFHAGGFVMGAPSIREARNRHLAEKIGCAIISVQYRLAPEAPFPAALEDAYAALTWLYDNAGKLSLDWDRIAVCGESAGGGIAASLAQLARDRNGPPIMFQALTYPMLDNCTGQDADVSPYVGEFVWTAASNRFAWEALLGDCSDTAPPPYSAAGRAEDLSGLPPSFIAVGAIDLFAEECIDYAKRLLLAGVPAELHVYPGAFHGFDSAPASWSADSFLVHQIDAIRRAFS